MATRFRTMVALSALFLFATPSMAIDFTWDLGADGDWTNPANWTPNGDPNNLLDNVFIDGGDTGNDVIVTLSLTRNIGSVTIDTGDELFVNNNVFLNVAGDIFNDGILSLRRRPSQECKDV
ncbi:MAG: hypothetical protein MI741_15485 [Rhodospirillales bacterium]|nr:hypothetical protein [Rhodospirillales bacterium]